MQIAVFHYFQHQTHAREQYTQRVVRSSPVEVGRPIAVVQNETRRLVRGDFGEGCWELKKNKF